MQTSSATLALDVGSKRIGLALARAETGLAQPYTTLPNDDTFLQRLKNIISSESVGTLVIGLPRGLEGQTTAQTTYVEEFAKVLQTGLLDVTLVFQDEAVTSAQAEAELQARRTSYTKEDIDALSATYILEDYLNEVRG